MYTLSDVFPIPGHIAIDMSSGINYTFEYESYSCFVVYRPSKFAESNGLYKSYVRVVPSCKFKNTRSPIGHGHFTLPNMLCSIVWT